MKKLALLERQKPEPKECSSCENAFFDQPFPDCDLLNWYCRLDDHKVVADRAPELNECPFVKGAKELKRKLKAKKL